MSNHARFHAPACSYCFAARRNRARAANDLWEVALIGKNLTNKLYLTGGNDSPSAGNGTGTAAGVRADQNGYGILPRTVQLQRSVNL